MLIIGTIRRGTVGNKQHPEAAVASGLSSPLLPSPPPRVISRWNRSLRKGWRAGCKLFPWTEITVPWLRPVGRCTRRPGENFGLKGRKNPVNVEFRGRWVYSYSGRRDRSCWNFYPGPLEIVARRRSRTIYPRDRFYTISLTDTTFAIEPIN